MSFGEEEEEETPDVSPPVSKAQEKCLAEVGVPSGHPGERFSAPRRKLILGSEMNWEKIQASLRKALEGAAQVMMK